MKPLLFGITFFILFCSPKKVEKTNGDLFTAMSQSINGPPAVRELFKAALKAYQENNKEGAYLYFRKLQEADSADDYAVIYKIADILYQHRDYEKVKAFLAIYFRKHSVQDLNYYNALRLQALAFYQSSDYNQALKILDRFMLEKGLDQELIEIHSNCLEKVNPPQP